MLLNRRGVFHAYATKRGVDDTGDNKLLTLTCQYQIVEEHVGNGAYNDVSAEGLDITGYHYIEKKDRSINERTLDSIKDSFGWDGRDIFQIQDDEKFGKVLVQIVCEFEVYNGKNRPRVQYLNPYGSSGTGGVTQADAAGRKAILARIGPKLRAIAGPETATRPATPPGAAPVATAPQRPASPPQRPTTPPAAAPAAVVARKSTQDDAWANFSAHCPQNWDQSRTEAEWFKIIDHLFPGVTNLSPEQFAELEDKCEVLINTPF